MTYFSQCKKYVKIYVASFTVTIMERRVEKDSFVEVHRGSFSRRKYVVQHMPLPHEVRFTTSRYFPYDKKRGWGSPWVFRNFTLKTILNIKSYSYISMVKIRCGGAVCNHYFF